ncbi:MAG: disulfide bond formation protein B [Pseudomonadota bacterium]
MTRRALILMASGGSAAMLAGAFLFQALGFAPCMMCLWQRWPHAAAVVLGGVALVAVSGQRTLACLGAFAALTTAGLGLYHTGVERAWWDGPGTCSGISTINLEDPLSTDIEPIVMCSDVTWSLFGLSMASYNALFSLLLAMIWIGAATRRA